MNELDERTFYLTLIEINASEISKVDIVPVFTLESGKEAIGDVKDSIILSETQGSSQNGSQQCTNDCSSGSLQCSGNGYQTCGNYDADSCLEWGSVTSCPSGQTCSNGYLFCQRVQTNVLQWNFTMFRS